MNFKDPKILAIVGVLVLVLIFGGLFFLTNKKSAPQEATEETKTETIPTLSKEDLGLHMDVSSDNTKVNIIADKVSDIQHIFTQVTYDHTSKEDPTLKVTDGFDVDEDVKTSPYETGLKLMGTCSKNICIDYKGIEEVNVLLKVTKKDGKIYQSKATFPMPK